MQVKSYTLLLLLALAGATFAQEAPAAPLDASIAAAAASKQPDAIAYSDALAADNMIDFSYEDTADWADALTEQEAAGTGEFSLDDALDAAEELADQDAIDAEYAVEASLDDLAAVDADGLQEGDFAVQDELDEQLAGGALDFAVEDALLDEDAIDEDGADADFATNEDALEDGAAEDSADFAIDEDAIEEDGFDADFSSDEGALEDDAFDADAGAGAAASTADFSTAEDAIAGELDAAAESVAEDLFNEAVNDAIESEFAQQDAVAASEEDAAAQESADYSQEEEAFENAFESELAEAWLAQPTLYAKSDNIEDEFAADAFDFDSLTGYQYIASAQESDA